MKYLLILLLITSCSSSDNKRDKLYKVRYISPAELYNVTAVVARDSLYDIGDTITISYNGDYKAVITKKQ